MRRLQDVRTFNKIESELAEAARQFAAHVAKAAPVCPNCNGHGVYQLDVPYEHDEFGKLFPCEICDAGQDLLMRRWMNGLQAAGLPRAYQSLTFDTWDSIPAKARKGKYLAEAAAKLFVSEPNGWVSLRAAYKRGGREYPGNDTVRNWLILQGGMGLGKTGLAAAIVNHRAYNKLPTLYVRFQAFLTELTDRFNDRWQPKTENEPKTAGQVLDLAKTAPVLVMDEINLQSATDYSKSVFEEIIRQRAGNQLPTVLTCNYDAAQLAGQWNERAVDVLLATAHWIPMGGQRLRAAAEPVATEVF